MVNEIEIKLMLKPESVEDLKCWLMNQNSLENKRVNLGNTYYDTKERYFSQHKMGLRVRNKNNQYELTLKTQGDIIGGLHIRPEYNLPLDSAIPDFKQLNATYQLQMEHINELEPIFSTDFTRETWLVQVNDSQIELALDQGIVKNQLGEEMICELELELKQGELSTLIQFLTQFPKLEGVWLSGLSKAERGYLIGNTELLAQKIARLSEVDTHHFTLAEHYQYEQNMADLLRLRLRHTPLAEYLTSADYLQKNIEFLINLYN